MPRGWLGWTCATWLAGGPVELADIGLDAPRRPRLNLDIVVLADLSACLGNKVEPAMACLSGQGAALIVGRDFLHDHWLDDFGRVIQELPLFLLIHAYIFDPL
ncbi:hypothetical protein MRX96_058219 [Rhipicephalus microplus]